MKWYSDYIHTHGESIDGTVAFTINASPMVHSIHQHWIEMRVYYPYYGTQTSKVNKIRVIDEIEMIFDFMLGYDIGTLICGVMSRVKFGDESVINQCTESKLTELIGKIESRIEYGFII